MGFFPALDGSIHGAGDVVQHVHSETRCSAKNLSGALSWKAVLQLLAGIGSASAGTPTYA